VVGAVVARALGGEPIALPTEAVAPGPASGGTDNPLASADLLVLAAWGVGTSGAATVTVIQTRAEVGGAIRLADDLVALGPADWTGQLEARAGLVTAGHVLTPSSALLARRAHPVPSGATGAVARLTARLPADARRSLALALGVAAVPGELALWADVADDLAIVLDADVADDEAAASRSPRTPGSTGTPRGKRGPEGGARLAASLTRLLARASDVPAIRALGVGPSLADLRVTTRGDALRAVLAISPARLRRMVERASGLLDATPGPPLAPAPLRLPPPPAAAMPSSPAP
jgi:hypothetical protein